MRGRRALLLAALGVVTIVAAVAAVVALRDTGTDDSALRPVRARTSLSDRIVIFGTPEEMRARLDEFVIVAAGAAPGTAVTWIIRAG